MADERFRRIVVGGRQVGSASAFDDADAVPVQLADNELADDEIAGESVGPFDQHELDAVQPLNFEASRSLLQHFVISYPSFIQHFSASYCFDVRTAPASLRHFPELGISDLQ